MSTFPDFSAHVLRILRELGRNPGGGRVTYLAQTSQGHPIVLKQFQFAKGGGWAGFKAIERETQTLKDLKHPGIPRYLGSFETEDGFCLLQEYKEARPLSGPRSFTPDELKQIAISLLEILVYLQDRLPPIFHRDIKPENVLVSDDFRVYLIDFGFARIGGENLAMSSVAMGTFGFMAPEQTRNLQLTTASDLYGLGLTLVCVIAQLKSHEIGEYVDFANQLDQKAIEAKLKGCSFRFIDWLNQMVAPDPKKRFPDAETALEALKPLYVKRTPEVKLNPSSLHFKIINKIKEKQTKTITLVNNIPGTILEGSWEVVPHDSDPQHTSWISFSPKTVRGNQVTCQVRVDTSYLQSEKQGNRELIFRSNAEQEEIRVRLFYQKLIPNVQINPPYLHFKATKLGEKITQTLTLTNSISETILEGYWEVAPHPNDPPHTPHSHPWISFSPKTVQGNQVTYKVTVDTGQLQTERQGHRELVFHCKTDLDKVTVLLQVETACQLVPWSRGLYLREVLVLGVTAIHGGLFASVFFTSFWTFVWLGGGAVVVAWTLAAASCQHDHLNWGRTTRNQVDWLDCLGIGLFLGGAIGVIGAFVGAYVMSMVILVLSVVWVPSIDVLPGIMLVAWSGFLAYSYLSFFLHTDYQKLMGSRSHERFVLVRFWICWLLALFCGGGIGAGIILGFTANILIPLTSLWTGVGLVYVSILPMLIRRRQLAGQRRQEQYLIEP